VGKTLQLAERQKAFKLKKWQSKNKFICFMHAARSRQKKWSPSGKWQGHRQDVR